MSRGNDAPPERVAEMFDHIAGVYDGMNLVISAFQEPRWRRRAVSETRLTAGGRALDVACGTGAVTRDLYRVVQPGGGALGIDVSAGMIDQARGRGGGPEYLSGDAMALPVADGTFDAATIAFGMRNLRDYEQGFREMARAVRPGGRVVCLEIARPTGRMGRVGALWFDRVVPLLGRLIGHGDAYRYLVRSTRHYLTPPEVATTMRSAGLHDVAWYGLSFGLVTIHTGSVAASESPSD